MDESMDAFMERAKRVYESKALERLGLAPEPEQREMILTFLCMVLRENATEKFVPEADEKNLFLRHFCDSIQSLLLFGYKRGALLLDIGSGGGFPLVPIRIFRPDLSFIFVEPNRGRAAFLERVREALGFDNMEVFAGKPEGLSLERKADYVIGRGVGMLHKFAQSARPLLAEGGRVYAYKTKQFAAELNAITENRERDGLTVREIAQYDLGSVAQGLSLVSMEFIK
jgi:16S rRNA (guanine527-N7)-methyltransferase